jgi:hypothetical protein
MMDLNIIHHSGLLSALKQGLNHIVLCPTNIAQVITMTFDAFDQLITILHLDQINFTINEARSCLHRISLHMLKTANRTNKYGFQQSGQFLLDLPFVQNELQWLLEHLFCAGLDKAANNASFICIKHIRLQALERLMGPDFSPCKVQALWELPTSILDSIKEQLVIN